MNFFDSGSETSVKYKDPYEYWQKYFGGRYGQAADLLSGLLNRTLNAPTSTTTYQLANQMLKQNSALRQKTMGGLLAQRGTAFGGQARRAGIDARGADSDALNQLLMRIQGQGQGLAGQLAGMSAGMYQSPLVAKQSTVNKTSDYQKVQMGQDLAVRILNNASAMPMVNETLGGSNQWSYPNQGGYGGGPSQGAQGIMGMLQSLLGAFGMGMGGA
ncbi:MAG: hypothetical protein C4542_04360 [Dehalococcoidia bacterium]|nr:MAG: hypothetical protein C4542_04360 [Dehalococcoidia bacterium]